jgi:fused signal recognition particle receptor
MKWIDRLKQGLQKTRDRLSDQISTVLPGRKIDEDLLEELEAILIQADMGVDTALDIIERLKQRAKREKDSDSEQLMAWLREVLLEVLEPVDRPVELRTDGQPTIFLILGVNGSGKTTSVAKMAQYFMGNGQSNVTLAAGDTFRAAAIEQLEIWSDRVGAKLIKHQANSDPSAVAFDGVDYAIKNNQDILLIDTAGRLQTKHNLMEELKKIERVVKKRLERDIDEILLVIDATNGQNALSQAKLFHEAIPLSGVVITKLDGTPKGGMVIAIARELGIPIKFIGVGESAEDLQEFKSTEFVDALIS